MNEIKLPDGYRMDTYFTEKIVTIVSCNRRVTVDFINRSYRRGSSFVYSNDADIYKGRGWKQRLINDAIKYLDSI